jgi:hypothetical protein
MMEGSFDRRAPRRWTGVHTRWVIEAIGSGALAQSTVRFDVRNPRRLWNEAARCANPILYFSVRRHK